MNSLRTKKKLKTRMPWLLPLVFLCLSVLFFSYTVTEFWFAQDDPETPAYSEEPNYLVDWDYIVVTWVANTVEYLTSLYLYVTDPKSATSVNMKYDPELNALLLNSSINANAMGIWFNEFWEWVVWSVFVWWSWNKISMRGQEVLDEYWDYTWTRNGKNDSAVAIWWVSNRPSSAWSVIIWWKNSSIWFTDSTMIWTVDSSLAWHTSVALWSRKSSLNVQDWNSVDMWYNNHGDKYTFLIWSWINTHWWSHWSAAVWWAFAYSPGNSGFALHGWNLWWQPWFYVNVKNGFWLNTSTPRLTFDFRSWWPLRVVKALWVQNNTMQFSEWWADWITCPDEVIVEKYRWTVAYVEHGWIWAFCWCNGKVWMPMSSDANEQALCAESKADARVCEGSFDNKTVIFHEETKWRPRWDEDANEWRWEWINLDWTYMWIPSLYSWDVRECSYTCAVWYHPNNKSAKWWFTGNCVACSELLNWKYISPGTGINDCEFACNWWYKYDKWAETEAGRCTPCRAWEWTEDLNQAMLCSQCELPVWISADWSVIYTWWVMWNWTTWTWEPYFRRFTSFSTIGEYGCDFQCASWFMYSYDPSGNSRCLECPIWTFSPWWTYTWAGWTCAKCTNRDQPDIQFSHKDINGKTTNWTILAKDASWYTTKWKNWPDSCEWICNPKIWLVKDWSSCKCPNGSHLESIGGQPRCVSDIADVACTGTLWSFAIKWDSIARWVSAGTLNWNNWEAKKYSWTYVNKPVANLGACEWTCPEDYSFDGVNNCTPPAVGNCGPKNWKLVDNLSTSDLCATSMWYNGFTNLAGEIEINYYVNWVFQFYPSNTLLTNPAKYLAIWTCKWYNWKPQYSSTCFAYVKWEAKKAQCPGEGQWRDASGKAQASCVYDTPNNCKEGLNCPPVMNKQDVDKVIKDESIDLDNVLPHWLMWNCPGTFWKEPTPCHSCDAGYSWWKARWGCTEDVITTHCKVVSSNSIPSNRQYTNFWPETYTNTFDKVADNYTPWIKSYRRLSDWSDPKNPCEWACQADTHFCSTRCELNPKCWSLQTDWSGNVIESYLCNIGSNTTLIEWDDDEFEWSCHNWCDYIDCQAESYSCEDTAPANTVYVWATRWLLSPASYTLYPEWSPHLWEPCSLACAYGYKYVDGHCEKVDKPECWEPNWKIWDWRNSPQYCEEAFGTTNIVSCIDSICASIHWASTPAYYNCKTTYTIYNYCNVWELDEDSFSRWGYVWAAWKCISDDNEVSCDADCNPWTDNFNPYTLCLGDEDSQTDSILVPNSATDLKYTWWDPWLTVTASDSGWLSGYWMMSFTASPNTGESRSTTIKFTSTNGDYCENWDLTIYQCGVGEENHYDIIDGNRACRCAPVGGWYSCPTYWQPAHSVNIWPIDNLSVEPSGYKLYEKKADALWKPCSVICEEGYEFFKGEWWAPDRCDKCPDWMVLNEEKTYCVVEISCPEWYAYNPETKVCDVMGNCLDYMNKTSTKVPSDGVTPYTYEESRPMWGNISWSCRKSVEDIRPGVCEFACKPGYLCSSDGGKYCFKPSCATFSSYLYWDTSIAVKLENPTYDYLVNIWWWYQWSAPWQYTWAGSLEAFNNWAYNEDGSPKVEGCWYWCNNNYLDTTSTATAKKCIIPNAPAEVYACIGSRTWTVISNIISTDSSVTFTDHNRYWTFVEDRAEYWNRVAQWEECLYTCKTGVELKTFSVWDLCAEECNPETEYMTRWWYCLSCDEGYKPDPNNKDNGVIMGCVYKCDSGQIWNEPLKACLANQVYELNCPDWMEELGRTPAWKLICWIKFE